VIDLPERLQISGPIKVIFSGLTNVSLRPTASCLPYLAPIFLPQKVNANQETTSGAKI
jgi:hypothetical protein